MAQKEIALQQVRMGKQRDLPLALEKGQIGFSTDVCRVFVGLPSTTDPASLVAGRNWTNAPNSGKENVEILTEFTDWSVVNKLINKPFTVELPPSASTAVTVQSTSRAFIEYIAYVDGPSTLLESGTVQLVSKSGVGTTLISQQNNTNEPSGLVCLDYTAATYDVPTQRFSFTVNNNSDQTFVMEFIIRGWDKQ